MTEVDALLEQARVPAAERDLPALLAILGQAWRLVRDPELADMLDLVSRAQLEREEALAKHKPWRRLALGRVAGDLGRLLHLLTRANWPINDDLRLLLAWPADPRLAAVLVWLLEHHPAKDVTHLLIEGILQIADPRTLASLEALAARDRSIGDVVEKLHARLSTLPQRLSPAAGALLVRSTTPFVKDWLAEERLLQRVHEDPVADEPRLIYADWLLERGRPRGEFITLQFRAARGQVTEYDTLRERALLRAHRRAWLGGLADAVEIPDPFERGFLSTFTLAAEAGAAALASVGRPEWATVRELIIHSGDPRLAPLVTQPTLRSLHTVRGLQDELFVAVATHPSPLAIKLLDFTLRQPIEPRTLLRLRVQPNVTLAALETLRIDAPQELHGWLFGNPLLDRLEQVVMYNTLELVPRWLRELTTQPYPRLRAFLYNTFLGPGLLLERDPTSGELSILTVKRLEASVVLGALQALPPDQLVRIRIAHRPDRDAERTRRFLDEVTEAARSQRRLLAVDLIAPG